jgi:N-alpha-acetyl-L-2,4-diaminobutyrate deacetylase
VAETEPKVGISIDIEAEGKHFGHLSIPHSRNESGWGAVHLPIVSIKNGGGPTVVFTGGNHGDEYEGPIALLKLVRALDPASVHGRVIVIPALNYPAVMGGARVSPIDGVNMNRAFPGRRDGSVTQMIAHFVQHKILPGCDVLFDIHSGGKTMMFSPFACYHRLADEALTNRAREAVEAMAAPISLELVELDAEGMIDTAVEDMGKIFVGTELGGGGTATTGTVAIAETAVRNLLAHLGVIDEAPLTREARGLPPGRQMHMPDPGCYLIADDAGLYEVLVDLDAEVSEGDPVGQVHFPERPERAPVVYRAGTSGTVIGRTHKVLVVPGDFLALIAHDL